MKKIKLALLALTLTGCVGPQIKKLEDKVASLERQQAVTDKEVSYYQAKTNPRIFEIEKKFGIFDFWGIINRVSALENFKEEITAFKSAHDKRWPPPVHLKSDKVKAK